MSDSCPGAYQGRDMIGSVPVGLVGSDIGDDDDDEASSEEGSREIKIPRDDLRNPSWIEDKDVLNGPTGHLKMDEIEFWKGEANECAVYYCLWSSIYIDHHISLNFMFVPFFFQI